ncbi:iron-containing alcohol dehydrogenase [Pontibacillus marinus]|uniref:Uncharacterized protein n=1 Tax=Pontibacillus marinus BH030004 = DSM 16465 TaxID=1385511 RepID=A0A0A5I460_9BACI|nr:iron-containing alcohol dehydrogenase [Pontibacillus marinus]KGX90612.1 hypothetical protein N783_19840 [Pontibacillus marinus BH030004 = DSM 16465]
MIPYQFQLRTAVHVGANKSAEVGEIVASRTTAKKAIIVSDAFLVKSGLTQPIEKSLIDKGYEVHIFDNVQSNPTMAEIDEVAQMIRDTNSDVVLGVGGGSPLDVAKTAAMVAGGEDSVSNYALGANPFPEKKVNVVGIPTTAGTGAEVTSTVIFSDEKHRKLWGWDALMAPEIAILDPSLTVKLPPHLTAATGLDAIVHAIEAATSQNTNPFIQGMAMQAIRLLSNDLPIALEKPENLQARENLLVGAALAGVAIEHGGTGLAHNIGHALSTVDGLHHGRAVAIALYHIYDYNLDSDYETVFADIARALGAKDTLVNENELAREGARLYRALVDSSPLALKLDGVERDRYHTEVLISTLSSENSPMRKNNCRIPTDVEMEQLVMKLTS